LYKTRQDRRSIFRLLCVSRSPLFDERDSAEKTIYDPSPATRTVGGGVGEEVWASWSSVPGRQHETDSNQAVTTSGLQPRVRRSDRCRPSDVRYADVGRSCRVSPVTGRSIGRSSERLIDRYGGRRYASPSRRTVGEEDATRGDERCATVAGECLAARSTYSGQKIYRHEEMSSSERKRRRKMEKNAD